MLQAGPAIKPAWKLAEETGLGLDPKAYIPGVRGYYSLPDGKLASMPFNSSTAVMWYNRDAFEKAGLDPDKPPATYDEFAKAARTLASKAPTPIASTSAWMTWIQFEEYAAIQNLAYATENDGYDGLGAELLINTKPFVDQLQRFLDLAKDGAFKYAGRDCAPDADLLLRPSRDRVRLVLGPRRHRQERPVPLRRGVPADRAGAEPAARTTRSSAAPACGR